MHTPPFRHYLHGAATSKRATSKASAEAVTTSTQALSVAVKVTTLQPSCAALSVSFSSEEVDLVDSSRSVNTEPCIGHAAVRSAADTHTSNIRCAHILPLGPLQKAGSLAGRLTTQQRSSVHKITLPTRHRKHTAPGNLFPAPRQSKPTYNGQPQDTASESVESNAQIPESAPGSGKVKDIRFAPVKARLMPSADGFDEYLITTRCSIPTGSASKAEILGAFEERIKTDVRVVRRSPCSRGIRLAADDSSEDEPPMNRVTARRAAAGSLVRFHELTRTVDASSKVAADVRTRATATTSRSQDEHSSGDSSDDEPLKTRLSPSNAACRTHVAVNPSQPRCEATLANKTVFRLQQRKHLDIPSRRSVSAVSKRHQTTPKPLPSRVSPRQPTPVRLKMPPRSKVLASLRRKTPDPPTICRRRYWDRLEALLPAYFARLNRFPRRKIFTEPTTAGVRLEELELFWAALVDLINEDKLFAKGKGWKMLVMCCRAWMIGWVVGYLARTKEGVS